MITEYDSRVGKHLEFEEILMDNDCAISDTSAYSPIDSGWWRRLYDTSSFRKVDWEDTESEYKYFETSLSFLKNPNVFSVEGVVLEVERLRDMVADKIGYLKRVRMEFLNKKRSRRDFGEYEGEEPLQEIHNLFHECYLELKKSRFKPRDTLKYRTLEEMTMDVAERTGSKIDFNLYNKRAKPKVVEDFHTDEQIVATAFYISSVENNSAGILTQDSDIMRIMENVLEDSRLLGLREPISRNGIRIYCPRSLGKAVCIFDSSGKFN